MRSLLSLQVLSLRKSIVKLQEQLVKAGLTPCVTLSPPVDEDE